MNLTKASRKQVLHLEAQINEQLVNLETQNDLLCFMVDDWSIWPVLRFQVGRSLRKLPSSNRHASRNRLQQISLLSQDLVTVLNAKKRRYVARTHDTNLSEKRGNLYTDIFFDDLLEDLDSWFKIEVITNPTFSAARKSMLLRTDMTSTLFQSLVSVLARKFCPSDIQEIAQDMSVLLCKQEGLAHFTSGYVGFVLAYFHWSRRLYKWLFKRIDPEYLFIVTAYTDHAIVAAAREQDICVVEFQHGYISPWHMGYSWSEYAIPYRTQMPIPDQIFLYGEYWRRELLANGFWNDELKVVGSLRIDHHRNKRDLKSKNCNIVLTTQGIDTDNLLDFMISFLNICVDTCPVILYVKLHPAETSKMPYEIAFRDFSNVHVLLSEESPSTFDLLSTCDLHLSIYSTCHYEALALGTPTVILPFVGHENVLSILECGYAFLAETPQDLVNLVIDTRSLDVPSHIGEEFFVSNALCNMKMELAK